MKGKRASLHLSSCTNNLLPPPVACHHHHHDKDMSTTKIKSESTLENVLLTTNNLENKTAQQEQTNKHLHVDHDRSSSSNICDRPTFIIDLSFVNFTNLKIKQFIETTIEGGNNNTTRFSVVCDYDNAVGLAMTDGKTTTTTKNIIIKMNGEQLCQQTIGQQTSVPLDQYQHDTTATISIDNTNPQIVILSEYIIHDESNDRSIDKNTSNDYNDDNDDSFPSDNQTPPYCEPMVLVDTRIEEPALTPPADEQIQISEQNIQDTVDDDLWQTMSLILDRLDDKSTNLNQCDPLADDDDEKIMLTVSDQIDIITAMDFVLSNVEQVYAHNASSDLQHIHTNTDEHITIMPMNEYDDDQVYYYERIIQNKCNHCQSTTTRVDLSLHCDNNNNTEQQDITTSAKMSERKPRPAYLIEKTCHIFGGYENIDSDDNEDDEFFVSSGAVYQSWPYVYEPGFKLIPLVDIDLINNSLSKSDNFVDYLNLEKANNNETTHSSNHDDQMTMEEQYDSYNNTSSQELPSYSLKNYGINLMHVKKDNNGKKKRKKRTTLNRKKSVSSSSSSTTSTSAFDDDEETGSEDESDSIKAYKQRHAIGFSKYHNNNNAAVGSQLVYSDSCSTNTTMYTQHTQHPFMRLFNSCDQQFIYNNNNKRLNTMFFSEKQLNQTWNNYCSIMSSCDASLSTQLVV
jgi:hypothetical protein